MRQRSSLILWVSVILLVLISGAFLFEIKEVPDVDWSPTFAYDSKEPYGTWMFKSLLAKKFGEDRLLYHFSDTLISKLPGTNHLYISIHGSPFYNQEERDSILSFVARGGEAMIINTDLDVNAWVTDSDRYIWSEVDSTIEFYLPEVEEDFSYHHYRRTFDQPVMHRFRHFDRDTFIEDQAEAFLYDREDYELYLRWPIGKGYLHMHLVPELFSNAAAHQSFFLEHFNHVFRTLPAVDLVILDHPSFNRNRHLASSSPLQYVLSQPSLAWAYYLLIITALIFLIFRGKRRQKIIPTMELNRNTSLEYAQIVSNLFQQQDQHRKLVAHLKEIFIHKIKSRYYLDYEEEDFVRKLAKKSQIHEDEVRALVERFEKMPKRLSFDARQLLNLYQKLEQFYKQSK